MNPFVDVTSTYERSEGGERWIRELGPDCWISVLFRRTGFGWREWETALVLLHEVEGRPRKWENRDVLIIAGDRRRELATMPKEQLRAWYAANIDGNRNSVDALIEACKVKV